MFTKTLLPDTFRALKLTSKIPDLQNAYLAGGTALALQIGHRVSVDLDFFTQKDFDENILSAILLENSDFKEVRRANKTLLGKIGDTSISLFYYKYRVLDALNKFEGINIVGKRDLAAMKLNAIEDRGTRRDFVDLFFLSKEFTLDEMLKFYNQKYKILEDHLYSIIRALAYFEEADMENEMPKMLVEVSWEEVKQFFKKESRRLANRILNL